MPLPTFSKSPSLGAGRFRGTSLGSVAMTPAKTFRENFRDNFSISSDEDIRPQIHNGVAIDVGRSGAKRGSTSYLPNSSAFSHPTMLDIENGSVGGNRVTDRSSVTAVSIPFCDDAFDDFLADIPTDTIEMATVNTTMPPPPKTTESQSSASTKKNNTKNGKKGANNTEAATPAQKDPVITEKAKANSQTLTPADPKGKKKAKDTEKEKDKTNSQPSQTSGFVSINRQPAAPMTNDDGQPESSTVSQPGPIKKAEKKAKSSSQTKTSTPTTAKTPVTSSQSAKRACPETDEAESETAPATTATKPRAAKRRKSAPTPTQTSTTPLGQEWPKLLDEDNFKELCIKSQQQKLNQYIDNTASYLDELQPRSVPMATYSTLAALVKVHFDELGGQIETFLAKRAKTEEVFKEFTQSLAETKKYQKKLNRLFKQAREYDPFKRFVSDEEEEEAGKDENKGEEEHDDAEESGDEAENENENEDE